MSSPSDLPFLAAISHLRLGPNVALAVLSGLLAIPVVVKMFKVKSVRFAHLMVMLLSLSESCCLRRSANVQSASGHTPHVPSSRERIPPQHRIEAS